MSFENDWERAEERISDEAGTLADVFVRLRAVMPTSLIDEECWQRILEKARNVPAAAAASPFGFELPLHDPQPKSDFGFTCIAGSLTARLFGDVDPRPAEICHLMDQLQRITDDPQHRAYGVVSKIVMMEYDIWSSPKSPYAAPGIFLYPENQALLGGGGSIAARKVSVLVSTLAEFSDLEDRSAIAKQATRIFDLIPNYVDIRGVGAFLGRGTRMVRISPTGFKGPKDISRFLTGVGYGAADIEAAISLASRLKDGNSYEYMSAAIDLNADGVGGKLGLAFFPKRADFLKPGKHWTRFIDRLKSCNLCVEDKLDAIEALPSGQLSYSGKQGRFVLVRGVQHIKLVFENGQFDSAKAYQFNVICAVPGPSLTS